MDEVSGGVDSRRLRVLVTNRQQVAGRGFYKSLKRCGNSPEPARKIVGTFYAIVRNRFN
jgi:hypothetical protein